MSESPMCSICGSSDGEWQKKWNSGNPRDFWFPACSCLEDEIDAEIDRRSWAAIIRQHQEKTR